MRYSTIKQPWTNFRMITANFSAVRNLRNFKVFIHEYRKNENNLDKQKIGCNYPKIWEMQYCHRVMCLVMWPKDADRMANSVDSDQSEPGHTKTCLMTYANNKGTDQPAHLRSLISTFVVRCLDSLMYIPAISKVSRLRLAFVAKQAGLNLIWSQIP